MINVAIIEDHDATRTILEELINEEPEHRCVCACSTSREAIEEVPRHQVNVALVDIFLPDELSIVEKTPDFVWTGPRAYMSKKAHGKNAPTSEATHLQPSREAVPMRV